jgi:hypothetical protein
MKARVKLKNLVLIHLSGIIFWSCGPEKTRIKDETIDSPIDAKETVIDATQMIVSELPEKFDSTEILLFGIVLVDLQERSQYSKFGSGSFNSSEIASSYFEADELIGDFVNIVFQDKNGNNRKLTDKNVKIRSVSFLRGIFEETKSAFLLYSVFDRDTNGDREINETDLKALYISEIDGSAFQKLTKEFHQLHDWRYVEGERRIYFRTFEDKNGDGELDNKDQFHYYFIEFSGKNFLVEEHNPLDVLK